MLLDVWFQKMGSTRDIMWWMLHLGCSKIWCPGYLCIDKVGPRDMGLRGRRRRRRPQSWQPLSCLAATILFAFQVEVLDARSMCLSCYQGWWHQIGYSSCNSLGKRRRLSLNMNCPIAAAASSSPSLEECCCKSSSYNCHLNYISYICFVRNKKTHTQNWEKPSLGFTVLSYHHAWLFCVSLIDWLRVRPSPELLIHLFQLEGLQVLVANPDIAADIWYGPRFQVTTNKATLELEHVWCSPNSW